MPLAAAEVLGTPIASCMVIEDSLGGLDAAKRAGAGHIVAVAPGRSRAKLVGVDGIDQIVGDFTEINRSTFSTEKKTGDGGNLSE